MTEIPPNLPPAYDGFPPDLDESEVLELPTYSRSLSPLRAARASREPREFTFHEVNSKGKPWATLKISADSVLSKRSPVIVSGSKLAGDVQLSLDSSEPIQEISVAVSKGALQTVDYPTLLIGSRPTDSRISDELCALQNPEDRVDVVVKDRGHRPFVISSIQRWQIAGRLFVAFLVRHPGRSDSAYGTHEDSACLSPPAEFFRE